MANQNAPPDWLFQDREELEEGGWHLHIKGVVPRLKSGKWIVSREQHVCPILTHVQEKVEEILTIQGCHAP